MGLTDVTGVLSRYFVVGFFLPAYVSLIALWLTASDDFIPNALDGYSEATQLAILAGVALVFALLLSGLNYPLARWFEGYPLLRLTRWPALKLIPKAAIALQRRAYNRLVKIRDDKGQSEQDRKRAYAVLDKQFPKSANALLPTRVGNVMRAYERHANVRWGIDGVTIWPRVSALMSDGERELHVDAKIDLFVFLNAAFGALVVAVCLVVDKAIHGSGLWGVAPLRDPLRRGLRALPHVNRSGGEAGRCGASKHRSPPARGLRETSASASPARSATSASSARPSVSCCSTASRCSPTTAGTTATSSRATAVSSEGSSSP